MFKFILYIKKNNNTNNLVIQILDTCLCSYVS